MAIDTRKNVSPEPDRNRVPEESPGDTLTPPGSARETRVVEAINDLDRSSERRFSGLESQVLRVGDKVESLPTRDDVREIVKEAVTEHVKDIEARYATKEWIYRNFIVVVGMLLGLGLAAANLYFRWWPVFPG